MILKFYRFLCGYLEVLLWGKYPGRFFNLCARNGICLWKVSQTKEKQYRFCIRLRDFWKIRPLCRKAHVRLLIRKRHGICFPIRKYHRRVCFLAAFWSVLCLLWILSDHVWKIEISGNSYLSEQVLTDYLTANNWGYGARKNEIDCSDVELSLRRDFPEIIWASSYLKGTMLVVEIQENLKTETTERPKEEEDATVNLAAAKEALITSIITRSGTPLVKAGDTVEEGTILVLGQEEILDDNGEVASVLYLPADADIMGSVTYEYSDVIPRETICYEDTGISSRRYFLEILDHTLWIPFYEPGYVWSRNFREYHQLCILDHFYLPVFWGREESFEQEETQITLDDEAAKQTALSHLDQFLLELEENGVSITDKNVIMRKEKDSYYITGTICGTESIGVYVRGQRQELLGEDSLTDEYE
jgi:similar to stage IV sporulation protein